LLILAPGVKKLRSFGIDSREIKGFGKDMHQGIAFALLKLIAKLVSKVYNFAGRILILVHLG
jgi:hypothetical protein